MLNLLNKNNKHSKLMSTHNDMCSCNFTVYKFKSAPVPIIK